MLVFKLQGSKAYYTFLMEFLSWIFKFKKRSIYSWTKTTHSKVMGLCLNKFSIFYNASSDFYGGKNLLKYHVKIKMKEKSYGGSQKEQKKKKKSSFNKG